jgi:hypothetical protein
MPCFAPSAPGGVEQARRTASIALNQAASPRTGTPGLLESNVDPAARALPEYLTTRPGWNDRKKGNVHAGSSIRIGK